MILIVALLAIFQAAAAQDGILGVGGFIFPSAQIAASRAAASLSRQDLSAVTVELQTTTGVKLHESDCAPNGYYFIPVTEPGTYVVRVITPGGWTFSPASSKVECTTQHCAENQDINFEFTGFSLQGKILGAGKADSCGLKAEAPSGVLVTVTSTSDPESTVTVESSAGQYVFKNLFPGNYKLTASHPDFDIAPAQLLATVEYDAVTMSDTFGVTGYKLSGFVTSSSGPVAGVQVLLYSQEPLDLVCEKPVGPDLAGQHLLCAAVSDDKGKYEFSGVHCAKYTLLPLHSDTEAGFEIKPSTQEAIVQQGHLVVGKAFEVTGFAVNGRVVGPSGAGLPGVDISLQGEVVASTDANGAFKISSLQAGTYTITAANSVYDFSTLNDFTILPGLKQLPDIKVERILATGSVSFTDDSYASSPRTLTISSEDGTFNQRIRTSDGKFSVKLPLGKYRFAPVVLPEEKAKGLVLSPGYADITVADKPVSNILFTQARFAISGSVKCLSGPCDGKLQLRVTADNYNKQFTLAEVRQGTAGEDGAVSFKLEDMVPLGLYTISAVDSGSCWEPAAVQVSLTSQDATAPALVQIGYYAQVSTTHAGLLTATPTQGVPQLHNLPAGTKPICLLGAGAWSLVMTSECFFFGKDPVVYDTVKDKAATVQFTAGQALVVGELHATDDKVTDVSLELANPVSGDTVVVHATADAHKPGVFKYRFFADLEANVQLQPKVTGALSYPKRQTVRVLSTACTPPVSPFTLKGGLFLEGATQPAVEGVTVIVKYKGKSAAGEVGEAGELQGSYLTAADGTFSVGPLYDDVEYDVAVEKTGYRFTAVSQPPAVDKYLFAGEKLASVTVEVDLASSLDKGAVLLSFSGDRGFRQNAKLGKDGKYTFYDMLPGTYYLRPQLREYQFEPAVAEIVVQDGGEHVQKFNSKRTAYSILGTARAINGQVLNGVVIEARVDGVVTESSISAEDGTYRIQGLTPGKQYTVSVRSTASILKGFPDVVPVVMEAADKTGVDFSAFPSSTQHLVTGVVDVSDALLGSTRVHVFRADTQQRVAVVPLDASRYYQVKLPQPGKYILRLASSLSESAYKSSEVTVQVSSEPVQAPALSIVALDRPRLDQEQAVSTSLAMPVTVSILLVGLAVWKKDFLAEVFQVGPALARPSDGNDAEWLSSSSLSKSKRVGSGTFSSAPAPTVTGVSTAAAPADNGGSTNGATVTRRASRIT